MRTLGTLATALLLVLPLVSAEDVLDASVTVTVEATVSAPLEEVTSHVPDPEEGAFGWSAIAITSALAGAEVGGMLTVEGTARATRGYKLAHVSIWVDGWHVGYASGKENWSVTLDTRLLPDGPHRLQATAFATPKATPFFVMTGRTAEVGFRTLNHVPGVVLFEKTMDLTGATADAWLVRLQQDYTGLRVTLRTEALPDGTLPAPEAQLAVAYKETEDDDQAPLRTWTATYGPLRGGATITRAPYPVMEAPGVLALAGVVAGEGRVHVKVEAVPYLGST